MIRFVSKLFLVITAFSAFTVSISAQKYVSENTVPTTIINAEELKALVKSPEKKEPILVNVWATWCGPCRAEFPDLVEIHKDYREKGLNFFVVSVDNVNLAETRVSDFLRSYEAEMPSFLLNYSSHSQIRNAIRQIAPKYPGGYPATFLFNKNGKLVYQKNGVIDAKILRKQIEKVLPK